MDLFDRRITSTNSLIFLIGLLCVWGTVSKFHVILPGGQSRVLLPPPPQIHHFAFGHSESLADLMWIRALQDFDYCEQEISKGVCKNNTWLYKILDAATNLSPKYRVVYSSGALALSVLVSDEGGASALYDKAYLQFPNDWPILYRGAYHALEAEKNDLKAAQLMERAAKNGAPDWVYVLSTKLYTNAGKLEMGERIYQEMKDQGFSPALLERMRKRLNGEKL